MRQRAATSRGGQHRLRRGASPALMAGCETLSHPDRGAVKPGDRAAALLRLLALDVAIFKHRTFVQGRKSA